MKKTIEIILFIIMILSLTKCMNRREVTEPDYKVKDLNRPSITEHTPFSEALDVSLQTEVTIYFSKLMNKSSIEKNFELSRIVNADSILTVVIDPVSETIMFSGKKNEGIFNSSNGGEIWNWISENDPSITVFKLVIAPTNSQVIFGLTNKGVIKSTDGGGSWITIDDRNFTALTISKLDENSVYVANATEGILYSSDGGATWTAKNSGLRVGRPLSDIAIEYTSDQILFLSSIGDYVYRSVNGADNWERVRAGLGSRDFSNISIAPTNDNVIYTAAVNGTIYKSSNSGENWSDITSNLPAGLIINDIVVSPISDTVVSIATSTGVFNTANGGKSWSEPAIFTNGGSLTESGIVNDLEIKTSDPSYILCGTTNGIFISNDGGEIFEKNSTVSKDNLLVPGVFHYENWQGETTVISKVDSAAIDTSVISPYVNERGLRLWVANGSVGEPPIEADPQATKMIYVLSEPLAPNWLFSIKVNGTFEIDKITPLESRGAEDTFGNSLETSKTYTFTTGIN